MYGKGNTQMQIDQWQPAGKMYHLVLKIMWLCSDVGFAFLKIIVCATDVEKVCKYFAV